jgi:transcriptional regulator GlxA family with amidase domain
MTKPAHYIFALAEDFTHLAFACAVEPLRIANLVSRRELYRWSYASANGETATASNGTVSLVHHGFANIPPCDRLFVLSGVNIEKPGQTHDELITALRRADRQHGTKVGALCSGAWILARAGFLNGMKAAIHWDFHDAFTEAFPEVNLLRNVFVADEPYVTASGGSATADLMLHLIEREHGYDLSVAVADQMVYNAVRDATAAQRVSLQTAPRIDKMRQHLDDPISPARIASDLGYPRAAGAVVREIPQHLSEEVLHGNAPRPGAASPVADGDVGDGGRGRLRFRKPGPFCAGLSHGLRRHPDDAAGADGLTENRPAERRPRDGVRSLIPFGSAFGLRRRHVALHVEEAVGRDRDRVDARLHQKLGEFRVVRRRLTAKPDLRPRGMGLGDGLFDHPQNRRVAFLEESDNSPLSRSTPSVSWVRSFDPMEKPSKRSANSSARITFDGISVMT